MKLFGRKAAGRGELRPVLARGWSSWAGSSGEWPSAYEPRVRAAYLDNPVAQRAVRLIADGVASAPVTASNAAALSLVAARSAGQRLTETMTTQLLLHGNAYVEVMTRDDGSVAELFALRPERVTIERDARGWPTAFAYKVGESVTRYPAEDARGRPAIVHVKTPHPLDDHYGLGCLGAAAGAVAIHNAATKWNKALLDNAARPSGAMVFDGGEGGNVLSPEQFERLRTELDAGFAGAANAGRPLILEGGLKWQALSLTPADMDFAGMKAAAAREIALAFGVPPMLLGLPGDAAYANYKEANKALWRLAVLPMAGAILDGLADALKAWFPGLTMTVDLDRGPALSEERERLWAQVSAADFLTADEKRAMVGIEGAAPGAEEPPIEVKFNPWHDPENGQFTFAGTGFRGGGGGDFGGGGATGHAEWPRRTSKPKQSKSTSSIRQTAQLPVKLSRLDGFEPPRRVVTSSGYRFEADSSDRAMRVSGDLRLQPEQGRSRREQREAGKPDRASTDHGGHFIAREFGGPEIALNHFAQDARSNLGEYRSLELRWKAALRAGDRVSVDIRPSYLGSSRRPGSLHVTYYLNGARAYKRIDNSTGGR